MILFGQTLSALELAAFVTGLAAVWLTERRHIANWPMGLLNGLCFAVLFAQAKLYADAALQGVFIVMGVWGWWAWVRAPREASDATVRVERAGRRETLWGLGLGVFGTAVVALGLAHFTDSPVPVPDAAILAFSLVATWAQVLRRLESWLIWIAVDIVSVPLYWHRDLPLTAGLYVIFLGICVAGWFGWRARWAAQRSALAGASA